MRVCALFVSLLMMAGTAAATDNIYGDPGFISIPGPAHIVVSGPVHYPDPVAPQLSITLPPIDVLRIMEVKVSPAWPNPSDEVSVAVTPKTSIKYLALDRYEISRQGDDIVIELYWKTNPPPPPIWFPVIAGSGGEIVNLQQFVGYGVQSITNVSDLWPTQECTATIPLGTFSKGTYSIRVHNHGVLEGEGWALFSVR